MIPEEEVAWWYHRHGCAEPPPAGTPRRGRASPPRPRDTFPVSSAPAHPSARPVLPAAPQAAPGSSCAPETTRCHRNRSVTPTRLGHWKTGRQRQSEGSAPGFLAEGRFAAGHGARSPRRVGGPGDGDLQPGHVLAVGPPRAPRHWGCRHPTGQAGCRQLLPAPAVPHGRPAAAALPMAYPAQARSPPKNSTAMPPKRGPAPHPQAVPGSPLASAAVGHPPSTPAPGDLGSSPPHQTPNASAFPWPHGHLGQEGPAPWAP